MRLTAGCILGTLLFAAAPAALAQSGGTGVVYSNKVRFAIPFKSDDSEIQRLGSEEIRLFVSVDRGGNWHQVQAVKPSARRFTVQAPKDGEYWFAVRTVDRDGQLHPAAAFSPELRVLVDTSPPSLELKLTQPQPGQVRLVWKTTGDHLDVSTLLLEQRRGSDDGWKRIFVKPRDAGSTTWNVSAGGLLDVRGKISDKAGNAAVAQDSIRVTAARGNAPAPKVPDVDDPVAGERNLPDRFPRNAARTERGPQIVPNGGPWQRPQIAERREARTTKTGFSKFPPASAAEPKETPRPQPKLVGRRKFRLNYTVEKVGKSGVESVELFITQDGGKKWYRYGEDADRTSPFDVAVPRDGVYGFAIRVRSGVGLAEPPPQPGEKPMILLQVDHTPPDVTLLPVLQGEGTQSDRFLIRWKATDAVSPEQQIALSYSAKPDGPWTSITDWGKDSGRHLWKTPPDVPPKIYIRVAARDAAGNVGVAQTPRPIIVDVSRPSARITNIDVDSK